MKQRAGRFAPSPTGPLHQGSLLAATASYLDARACGLQWWLRIDDLDTPRTVAGAEDAILTTLEAHALHWDGPVSRQSAHADRYEAALRVLSEKHLLFYCTCTRQRLAAEPVYPGTCRQRRFPIQDAAVRLRVDDVPIRFHDLIQGDRGEVLTTTCGDFVVRRRDGLIAYQLATAVDDGDAAIVRVVRGGDLLDNVPRQIFLMHHLGLSVPDYAHLPIVVDGNGQKLSKQTHAPPIDDRRPTANLLAVFGHLGLQPPRDAARWSPDTLLEWAIADFDLGRIRPGTVPVIV